MPIFTGRKGAITLNEMAKKNPVPVVADHGLVLEYPLVGKVDLLPVPLDTVPGLAPGWSNVPQRGVLSFRIALTGKERSDATPHWSRHFAEQFNLLERSGLTLLPCAVDPFSGGTSGEPPAPGSRDDLMRRTMVGDTDTHGSTIEFAYLRDEDLGRTHTAVRMVLSIIPAIAAASPFRNGKRAGALDARLLGLIDAPCRIPALKGAFVPEVIVDEEDYFRRVMEPIALALAAEGHTPPIDHQLLDRRAAIPLFDRHVIAIRVADMQECPAADVAVAEFVRAVVDAMLGGRWVSNYLQRAWHEHDLLALMRSTAISAGNALIDNRDHLLMFGLMRERATAKELCVHLFNEVKAALSGTTRDRIAFILDQGCLAERILRRTGPEPSADRLREMDAELAELLRADRMLE